MKTIWPFSFYFLLFAAFAFVAPFMVLYYQSIGFTGTQIGLITGLTPLMTLLSSPFWTGLADVSRRHRLILGLILTGALLAIVSVPFLHAYLPVLLAVVLFNLFIGSVPSFGDAATMHVLGERRALYGRVRLGGTIGWALAATLGGLLVESRGLQAAFFGCAALLVLCTLVVAKLEFPRVHREDIRKGEARALFRNRGWYAFLTLAFAGGLAMAAANNYLPPYIVSLGGSGTTVGLALTIGTAAEFPILFFGDRLIRKFKPEGVLWIAMIVTGARLLLFASAGTPEMILLLQGLNGLAFPMMWMAGVAYADANSPVTLSATGQGLFNAMVWGFGNAVGGMVGGPLLEAVGGRGLFTAFGIGVLAIVIPVSILQKRLTLRSSLANHE